MKAEAMRVFTPMFPLRTKVDSLDVEFSTDSLTLHNTVLSAGKSRMTVEGEIRNIRSSLSGNGRRPLVIDMDVKSSFIDVNELTQAAMKGAAYARKVEEGTAGAVAMTDDSASLQKSVESQVDDDDMTAFVIPGNISASVKVDADNVVYSDVLLRHLTGRMSVYKGALSLERLAARSAVGDVNFYLCCQPPVPTA